jgi:hypothetical protein
MLALIAGMVSCGPVQYKLTISSTEGGKVTKPGEGTFTYGEGAVVNLVAKAEEGYHFVKWIGNVSTIEVVKEDDTIVIMNGDYSITANFVRENLEIRNWYDLDAVRYSLAGNHTLMNDLDSTTPGYTELACPTANQGAGWQPIGTSWDNPFTGSFDGQGYEIRDLFINRPGEDFVGLFGDTEGVIKDIGVVNATVSGHAWVSGLVGLNGGGTVSNSYFTGSVTGTGNGMFGSTVGGLVGANGGTVSNSYSSGSVTGSWYVGGLVGQNWYTVSNSYSTGSVTGDRDVGGLVGHNDGTVSNSYSTGNVTGYSEVGGLVGTGSGTVSNSFWDIQTSGQSTSDGGTGKTTAEMKDIDTFSGAGWNIIAVANPGTRNPAYTWNIVDDQTYPFLSWQP